MEQKNNEYLIGTGVRDITPAIGVPLVGGVAPYISDGIATRLYVKALALASSEEPEEKVLFITLDNLKYPEADKARDRLSKSTGLERPRILVTASHAHSCPWYEDYGESLVEAMEQAAADALASMECCGLYMIRKDAPGISQNRRVLLDGVCWNTWLFPREDREKYTPAAEHDISVQALAAKRPDGSVKAVIFNFACHACNSGLTPTLISADYPGYVRLKLDERLGYHTETLFFPGACGDVNGTKTAEVVGNRLGEIIADSLPEAEPVPAGPVRIGSEIIGTEDRQVTDFKSEEVAKTWEDQVEHFRQGFEEAVNARKEQYLLEVDLVDIAGHTAIITCPVELFTEIGMEIKKESPFAYTIAAEQTNGAYGYVPTKKGFTQGGYETFYGEHSFLKEDAGEKIFEASVRLLNEYKK